MSLDGRLIVHTGATRGGKTLRCRLDVKDDRRLLVWDIKGKWASLDRCEAFYSIPALVARIKQVGAGAARLAFISHRRGDFGPWAEAAYWWGRWGEERGHRTTVVAEETADVTSPNKAPDGFHRLLSQGLEFGITVYALTQRPAESDKTSIGNASLFRVFAPGESGDAEYMARKLRCDPQAIEALLPLEYIERDRATLTLKKFRAKSGRPFPKWTEVPLKGPHS